MGPIEISDGLAGCIRPDSPPLLNHSGRPGKDGDMSHGPDAGAFPTSVTGLLLEFRAVGRD